jgi:hypothetical protein
LGVAVKGKDSSAEGANPITTWSPLTSQIAKL